MHQTHEIRHLMAAFGQEARVISRMICPKQMPRNVCVKCHRETLGNKHHGGDPRLPHVQADVDQADAAVIEKKEASEEWTSYLRLRTSQAN